MTIPEPSSEELELIDIRYRNILSRDLAIMSRYTAYINGAIFGYSLGAKPMDIEQYKSITEIQLDFIKIRDAEIYKQITHSNALEEKLRVAREAFESILSRGVGNAAFCKTVAIEALAKLDGKENG